MSRSLGFILLLFYYDVYCIYSLLGNYFFDILFAESVQIIIFCYQFR